MFIAMGLMLLGMTLGWLLRGRAWLGLLTRCVSPAIICCSFLWAWPWAAMRN